MLGQVVFVAHEVFVARNFPGDDLQMVLDFLQLGFDPVLVLVEQLQAFRDGLLPLAEELSIALERANRHPGGAQVLEEFNPGDILQTIGAVATGYLPLDGLKHQTGTFVIAQGMGAQPGGLGHLLDGERLLYDRLLFHRLAFPAVSCGLCSPSYTSEDSLRQEQRGKLASLPGIGAAFDGGGVSRLQRRLVKGSDSP